MSLEVTVQNDGGKDISAEMKQNLKHEYYCEYKKLDTGQFNLKSCETLASNYNELQQIKGFLTQLNNIQEVMRK